MHKVFMLFLVSFFGAKAVVAQAKRPNIIVLITDDQRWDAMGAAGNKIIHTPNMDLLAQKGLYFKNAFVTTSICCVSRASILSGQHVSRHKISDFSTAFSPEAFQKTYPMLLRAAGYKTGFIGKFGVGAKYPDPSLFDYWGCSRDMDARYLLTSSSGQLIHNTDSVGNSIASFLGQYAKEGPFCLSVSFKAPHELDGDPPTYPVQEKFRDLYANAVIQEPFTAAPTYWQQFPDFFRTDKNIGRVRWKPLFRTPELHAETVKNYYRLITGVDEVIGSMMQQLAALGVADNTIIILMGDNGFSLGEHGLEGKWYAYNESVRVPLIVYDPRLSLRAHQHEVDAIALNIDLAPTIVDLAGIPREQAMQGENLIGMAQNKKKHRRDFFYKHDFLGSPALPASEAVVGLQWKYIVYTEHNYEQLFQISKDPYETRNLAEDPAYATQLDSMRTRYRALKIEAR